MLKQRILQLLQLLLLLSNDVLLNTDVQGRRYNESTAVDVGNSCCFSCCCSSLLRLLLLRLPAVVW